LVPIKPIKGCQTIVGDITSVKSKSEISHMFNGKKVDVVLHDGAPNVGTTWNQDAYSQSELVLASLKLATSFLKKDGYFVTKVFRSQDYNALLWVFFFNNYSKKLSQQNQLHPEIHLPKFLLFVLDICIQKALIQNC